MHALLERQLARATHTGQDLDVVGLLQMVDHTYEEYDRSRRLQDRAMQLVSEELQELNAALRVERDEAVAQSQKRFELAVESTNDGIWDWDFTSGALWFSPRCKTMLGCGPEQMKNATIDDWYQRVHAPDMEKAKAFIAGHMQGTAPPAITLRFMHADGALRHIMCRASAMRDGDGRVVRLVGVHTDITELIAMQEEIQSARERAEAASRAKSDFLANMSHEIRTPMNSIMGMTQLLLETQLDQQQRLWAEIARNSSESLLDIINDILDISKIEVGKLELEKTPFDLFPTVEQVTDTLVIKAREKNIELLTRFGPRTPRYLIGDPVRLRQILINLVGNAIKFTTEGHVAILVDRYDSSADKATLSFQVEDTGIGIPPDKVSYIFEKFTQAEESTTRKFGGTGLGLAICRKLTQLMDGHITVSSEPGKGSQFFFNAVFPIDPSAFRYEKPAPDFSFLRIVAIDDNAKNLSILQEYFSAWKAKAACFMQGEEALAAMACAAEAGEPFHMAFVDYHLFGMNGKAFAAEIHTRGFPGLQLIAMRNCDPGNLRELEADGFHALLLKPYCPARLAEKLAILWATRRQSAAAPLLTRYSFLHDQEHPDANHAIDYSHLKILVAEDLKPNQIYMQALLKKYRCPVQVAANGVEAVHFVQRHDYDIVFMDCQMPEMDGFAATRAIRALSLRRQPFIVALTADAMQGDRERCLGAGMDEYLNKPVKAEKIAQILDTYARCCHVPASLFALR